MLKFFVVAALSLALSDQAVAQGAMGNHDYIDIEAITFGAPPAWRTIDQTDPFTQNGFVAAVYMTNDPGKFAEGSIAIECKTDGAGIMIRFEADHQMGMDANSALDKALTGAAMLVDGTLFKLNPNYVTVWDGLSFIAEAELYEAEANAFLNSIATAKDELLFTEAVTRTVYDTGTKNLSEAVEALSSCVKAQL
mgnify:CR=1 FL=1